MRDEFDMLLVAVAAPTFLDIFVGMGNLSSWLNELHASRIGRPSGDLLPKEHVWRRDYDILGAITPTRKFRMKQQREVVHPDQR